MITLKQSFYEARFGFLGQSIPVLVVPSIAIIDWKFWAGQFAVFLFILLMGFLVVKRDELIKK